jgi:glycosyltransferase involved in cell wall biosynthesis
MAATLTVVLSNFNHARFLPAALEALLRQHRPADELIIIDDASTDDSVAVISAFLPRHPNARLHRNPANQGVIRNMNDGLQRARSSLVYFAAADDITYPSLFTQGVALLEAFPEAALFSSRSDIIDAAGRNHGVLATPNPRTMPGYLGPGDIGPLLMRGGEWFMGNTTLYRRAPLLAEGGFAAELGAYTDGYISCLLALKHGACYAPDVLAAWRRMDGGMAWSHSANRERTAQLIATVERKMSAAGTVFPTGYVDRWRRRYLFGARRFTVIQATRGTRSQSAWRGWLASAGAVILVAWWFVTLRPWDVVSVTRRRLHYLFSGRTVGRGAG